MYHKLLQAQEHWLQQPHWNQNVNLQGSSCKNDCLATIILTKHFSQPAGGTNLSVMLEKPLGGKPGAYVYCRFDSVIVFNVAYNANATGGPTVTFVAPPFIEGTKEVDLAFSVDGLAFEAFGKFIYHGE